jgi:hypothetical protein
MSINRLERLCNTRLARLAVSCVVPVLLIVCADSWLPGDNSPQKNQQLSSAGHQLVVLLDTNPHQKNVLTMELTLAEEIIQKLNQPGNVFSLITFGSQSPDVRKSAVPADPAIVAVRDVTVEQMREKYFSVDLHDALDLALGQFADDARPKSLLVISEGNDFFPGKTFNQTVSHAQQLQVACNIAMVADHTFYGTKGIQRYGFDLRRLAGKTHGRYVEVGGGQKRISRSVDRLSESILNQAQNQGLAHR